METGGLTRGGAASEGRGSTTKADAIAPWPSEREVADELPIDAPTESARRVLRAVPFWFHTFSLDRAAGLYTPGAARDHGYRLDSIPTSFEGQRVLDVGSFDGFYAFLAEHRGAQRVVAVDNEQYRHWVTARWGVELAGGEGFRAIHELLGSSVEYRRMDAQAVSGLDEEFDFIFCYGILHRVQDPLGLLRVLVSRLSAGGRILIETAGVPDDAGSTEAAILVPHPGDMYALDHYVFWQFSSGALRNLAAHLGGYAYRTHATPIVDGHPRIVGFLDAPERLSNPTD